MGVADRESISTNDLLWLLRRREVATVSFVREQAEHVVRDMELGELTDEQWEVIVSEFPNYSTSSEGMFEELVEEVCSRKHADTPTWREYRAQMEDDQLLHVVMQQEQEDKETLWFKAKSLVTRLVCKFFVVSTCTDDTSEKPPF